MKFTNFLHEKYAICHHKFKYSWILKCLGVCIKACIYLKSINWSNNITVHLIISKTSCPTQKDIIAMTWVVWSSALSRTNKDNIRHIPFSNWFSAPLHRLHNSVTLDQGTIITLDYISCEQGHKNSKIGSWKYISGTENPAAFLSRGLLLQQIIGNQWYWRKGPLCLQVVILTWFTISSGKLWPNPRIMDQLFEVYTQLSISWIFKRFERVIHDIKSEKAVNKNSQLVLLNPYLENELIKVRG